MGTCTYAVTQSGRMITGEKYARGWITMGTYETSGDSLNLANVFKSSTECTVIPAGNDGYQLEATQGRNADNQLIMAYYVGNINAATGPLTQVANAVDLSAVNAQFFAIGQPY